MASGAILGSWYPTPQPCLRPSNICLPKKSRPSRLKFCAVRCRSIQVQFQIRRSAEHHRRCSGYLTTKMALPLRGEVWLVDLGMAAKVRPALVVSTPFSDRDRSLVTVIPHTTALRGSTLEIAIQVPFLKPGAFLVQGITTVQTVYVLHRLGALAPKAVEEVLAGLWRWLGHGE